MSAPPAAAADNLARAVRTDMSNLSQERWEAGRPFRTFRRFPVLPRTRANGAQAIDLTKFRGPESQFLAGGTGQEPALSRSGTEPRANPNRNRGVRLLSGVE